MKHTLVRAALARATRGLVTGNAALCGAVVTADDEVDRHYLDIERRVNAGLTYFRPNAAFHAAVARASHNNVLAESVQQLIGQVRLYRERLMREIKGMPAGDVAEHGAVLAAIGKETHQENFHRGFKPTRFCRDTGQ